MGNRAVDILLEQATIKIYRGGKSLYENVCWFSKPAAPESVLIFVLTHNLGSRCKVVGYKKSDLTCRVYSLVDSFAVTSISIFIFLVEQASFKHCCRREDCTKVLLKYWPAGLEIGFVREDIAYANDPR